MFRMMRHFLLPVLGLCASGAAQALTCTVSLNNFNFGSVNVLSAANPLAQVTSTATVTCDKTLADAPGAVTVCAEVGTGTGGRVGTQRTLASGANRLNFNLFKDAGGTDLLGTQDIPLGTPLRVAFQSAQFINLGAGLGRRASTTVVLHGRLNGAQPLAAVGSYSSSWSAVSNAAARWRTGDTTCPTAAQAAGSTVISFQALAVVEPFCSLQKPADLSFGSRSSLAAAVDGTTAVQLTCTRSASYSVALDNGVNFSSTRRMRLSGSSNYVNYQLYQDAARTQLWETGGNAQAGTGSGQSQTMTVYGRVPVQASPTAGTYADTVTVVVTF